MNKRSFFGSLLMLMLPLLNNAQVVMQPQAPPLGLTIKPQLWNLALVNATKEPLNVRIEMTMTDVSTNQRVLTGTTRSFILPDGAKQVQAKDVIPVTYNAGSSLYSIDPSPEGFLPTGVFNICYTLIGSPKGVAETTITESCETYEIEPLSPPQLVSPMEQENIETPRPLFTWLPPAPLNNFSRLTYDWILVELQPTQSPADAIQMNMPVHTRQQIEFTNFQYPQMAPALDTAKTYAWRVTAKNNLVVVANSEVWTFRIPGNKPDSIFNNNPGYYARLHSTEDAAFTICNGVLRLEYNNLNNQQQLQFRLFDITSSARKEINMGEQQQLMKPGQNFLNIDLRGMAGMVQQHFYLLQVQGANNEKWYLKFEYKKK